MTNTEKKFGFTFKTRSGASEKSPQGFTLISKLVKANSIGFTLISRLVKANPPGFTLIELLVVTAILGILVGISSSVFVGILRSQNKTNATNEVRQNANLAIDLFERDIRSAQQISVIAGPPPPLIPNTNFGTKYNGILVVLHDGSEIRWYCDTTDTSFSGNGAIFRDINNSHTGGNWNSAIEAEEYITNIDPRSGVNIDCSDGGGNGVFQLTGGTGGNQLVTFEFTARQGVSAPARNDYQIELKFRTTLGTRNRN